MYLNAAGAADMKWNAQMSPSAVQQCELSIICHRLSHHIYFRMPAVNGINCYAGMVPLIDKEIIDMETSKGFI